MTGALVRISGWLAPPVPARRLALVRVAVLSFACGWLLVVAPDLVARSRLDPARWSPVGLSGWAGVLAPGTVIAATSVVVALGLVAVSGRAYRVVAPVFALGLAWLLSYRNSWGHLSHGEHLLVLQVAIVALAPAADALRPGARTEPGRPHARYGWPLVLIMLVTVSTYAIAGVAKLRGGGLAWMSGDALRLQVAHEALRSQLVGVRAPSPGHWLLPQVWLFQLLAVSTMVLELGAPLALWPGRVRAGWIAGLWSMHAGIWVVMGIGFPYPLSGVAFVAFAPLERGEAWVRERAARRRAH